MVKVLITGGAGFIGSHTAHRLLEMGHMVTIYDTFTRYVWPISKTYSRNMCHRVDVLLKGAAILRGDIRNVFSLRRSVEEKDPDCIIHLAALPLANVAIRNSDEAFGSIVRGIVNLLEILRDHPRRLVYVSSSMVYGDFDQDPMPEDGRTVPKEIYGGMKLAGEILVKVYAQRYDIPVVIVRPSAVYGPTDVNRRVLQIFVEGALGGRTLTAVNPDSTVLDFTFVEDTAQGLALAALKWSAIGQTFNVTRGDGRSLSAALKILRGFLPDLKVRTVVETGGYRPRRGTLDISKARTLLGYDPQYSLEEGLATYVRFVAEQFR